MNRQAPDKLALIGLDPSLFKYSDEKSWRGPCSVCGGHRRFVVFTDHEWPMWHGFCSECGMTIKAWEIVKTPMTEDQKQQYREHAQQIERDRQSVKQAALAKFTTSELWEELHRRLSAEHRAQWSAWGVPDEWQDYLDLGFTPDKIYRDEDGNIRHTPAYTIPYFLHSPGHDQDREFRTLQYRLFNAPDPNDRYRFEYGLESSYYMTTPSDPIGDCVVICEGAKKGIVTRVHLFDGCVLAVPSKTSFGGVQEAVKGCGIVYVLLDPDAKARAVKLARDIGPQARIVRIPIKVDDAAIDYGLDRYTFGNILKQSWRVS